MRALVPLACWMVPALAMAGTTPTRPSPAEELDAELATQVKIPGPELVVVTDGPDPSRFDLLEGTVELDGRPLAGTLAPGWGKPFFQGPVVPGNHVLTAQFAYRGSPTGAYPWSGSYTYRVPGKVEFQAQRGLRLVVHLRVEVHEDQPDPKNRLAFRAALEPEMIAQVDDSPMPPPPPRKVTPEQLFTPKLEPAVLSTPAPAPAPKVTRKPKPKKVTPAAQPGVSLDVATARLQKAIATPADAGKPPKGSPGGQSTKSKGPPDAGPLRD